MMKTATLDSLKIRLQHADLAGLERYQQVQRALRALILEGALPAGTRLPSTRQLATSLSLARDTVENAYLLLYRDGFIVRRPGSGSYVAEGIRRTLLGQSPAAKTVAPAAVLSQRGSQLAAAGPVADPQTAIPLVPGLPETRLFPFDVWLRLQRRVIKQHGSSVLLAGDPQGALPLRQAVATHLNLERGTRVDADQILIVGSTRQALFLCAHLLCDAGQPLFIEDPAYYGARKTLAAAGLTLQPVPVDRQGMQVARLPPVRGSCVYVTPSHQYPTGAVLALERRLALTAWAAANEGWILEDDYNSEFHDQGLPTACVHGLDAHGRTLYLGTFSKALFPGLRLAYLVLPPSLMPAFVAARSVMDGHSPLLAQLTLAAFMDGGHYQSHVRTMCKLYARRRDRLAAALVCHAGDGVECWVPSGGLHLPCLLPDADSERHSVVAAAAEGLQLLPLSSLYLGSDKRHGWLLGYAALGDAEIDNAALRLARILADSKKAT